MLIFESRLRVMIYQVLKKLKRFTQEKEGLVSYVAYKANVDCLYYS